MDIERVNDDDTRFVSPHPPIPQEGELELEIEAEEKQFPIPQSPPILEYDNPNLNNDWEDGSVFEDSGLWSPGPFCPLSPTHSGNRDRLRSALKIPDRSPEGNSIRKMVRFADSLGLDLEQIRNQPPPEPTDLNGSFCDALDLADGDFNGELSREVLLTSTTDSDQCFGGLRLTPPEGVGFVRRPKLVSSDSNNNVSIVKPSLINPRSSSPIPRHPDKSRFESRTRNLPSRSSLGGAGSISSVPTLSGGRGKVLTPCFKLGSSERVEKRVAKHQVALDSFLLNELSFTGVIKVSNLSVEKEVSVRYSLDNWESWSEVRASFIPNSSDGQRDKFVFTLFLPSDIAHNTQLHFALRYTLPKDGKYFWDNNNGDNYVLHCTDYQPVVLQSSSFFDQSWIHFM